VAARTVLLAALLAVVSTARVAALTPQNQCSGDCSPCLNSADGTIDPFCTTTDPNSNNNSGATCLTCEIDVYPGGGMSAPYCTSVAEGETGHTGCAVTTTATKTSCMTSGTSCVGASIHH
jgi:hypothetical protein